jgi:predicted exporter
MSYCFPENAPINAGVSNLWIGEAGGNYYSCVLPFHPGDEAAFKTIAEELSFAHFINKAHDISRDLDTLTRTMVFFFLAAYLVVSVLVFFVYPWRDSLGICAIPLFLILSVLAVLAANKIPAGFFSAAAIVLVFGLGMDYVFYMIGGRMTGKKRKEDSRLASFAVALSFLTTLLSFGALAASSFVPVHIFGLTVSAGLAAAFISAMLLTGRGD